MKKLFHKIAHNKIWIVILLITFIGFPGALVKSAQGEITTIVVSVGIDKEEDDYSVSITSANQIIGSGNQELDVVQDKGKTLSEAFNNISRKTGKVLGFEHCNLIVLSDGLAGEDCKVLLDVLYRKSNIKLNAFVVSTDNSAKDILVKTTDISNSSSDSLQNNLGFNKNNYSGSDLTTLGEFFNDYYSQSKCSTVAFLPSVKESENATKTEKQNKVENNGETAIFVEGKKVCVVGLNLTNGINWINQKKIVGNLIVENVYDEKNYDNAIVGIFIKDGKISVKPEIVNDILVLKTKIDLYVEIIEINQQKNELDLNNGFKDYLSNGLKDAVKNKVLSEIEAIIKFAEEKRIDIYKFKNRFYQSKYSSYSKWLKSHNDDDLYVDGKVETQVNIYSYR